MKLVHVKSKFKHDSQTFYPGEVRMVSDEDSAYFIKHGWATANAGDTPAVTDGAPVKLDVQNATIANAPK